MILLIVVHRVHRQMLLRFDISLGAGYPCIAFEFRLYLLVLKKNETLFIYLSKFVKNSEVRLSTSNIAYVLEYPTPLCPIFVAVAIYMIDTIVAVFVVIVVVAVVVFVVMVMVVFVMVAVVSL